MSQRRPIPEPVENPQGDYIEAAIHALHANNPRAALRYLTEGLDPRQYVFAFGIPAGESND